MATLHHIDLTDEILELFLLHRLDERQTESVETHIIACDNCITRLEAMEEDILCLRTALADVAAPSFEDDDGSNPVVVPMRRKLALG